MGDVLPTLLVIAVGLCLSLVLLALWQSLRGLLAHVQDGPARAPAASAARAALQHEKDELLAAIRELRFEHELGKVSAADFARLEQRYRTRARDVLRELDEQIAPHRARAAQLLEQALASGAAAEVAASQAATREPGAAATGAAAPVSAHRAASCAQCGTENDADALFCKKCGRRMRDEVRA
jgi:hypothetical protein